MGNVFANEVAVTSLKKYTGESAEITKWACGAVANLASDGRNCERLCCAGACAALVLAVNTYKDEVQVIPWACAAVAKLAFHFNLQKECLVREGACEAILAALSTNISSVALAEWVCCATEVLASSAAPDECYQRVYAAGGCETLIKVFYVHTSTRIVGSACRAVRALTRENMTLIECFRRAGACEALVSVLSTQSFEQALDPIRQLATRSPALRAELCTLLSIPDEVCEYQSASYRCLYTHIHPSTLMQYPTITIRARVHVQYSM
jgi:hypothetical protein